MASFFHRRSSRVNCRTKCCRIIRMRRKENKFETCEQVEGKRLDDSRCKTFDFTAMATHLCDCDRSITCTIEFFSHSREKVKDIRCIFFLQWNLVIRQEVGMYLQFGIFLTSIQCVKVIGRCQLEGVFFSFFSFFNPWCAVKLTKWRNVIFEFIHGAFKGKFICQQVIGWPSIILS